MPMFYPFVVYNCVLQRVACSVPMKKCKTFLLHGITKRSTTSIFCAGHLHAPSVICSQHHLYGQLGLKRHHYRRPKTHS